MVDGKKGQFYLSLALFLWSLVFLLISDEPLFWGFVGGQGWWGFFTGFWFCAVINAAVDWGCDADE